MPESKSPLPELPPDAPKGAVYQLNGGIYVDERGQEVGPPKVKARPDAEAPSSPGVSPQLEAYLAPRSLDAIDSPPSHEG